MVWHPMFGSLASVCGCVLMCVCVRACLFGCLRILCDPIALWLWRRGCAAAAVMGHGLHVPLMLRPCGVRACLFGLLGWFSLRPCRTLALASRLHCALVGSSS